LGNFREAIVAIPLANFLEGILLRDLGNFLEGIFFLDVENLLDGIFLIKRTKTLKMKNGPPPRERRAYFSCRNALGRH
jgi:hypothetical protein